MSFWFRDFALDQERRQLLRSGQPVPLEPKAYELLSLLLERRPRALSRAQIRDVIWPRTFVSESTLAVVVNGIRQALDDDARNPRFIRTVHGFGYAFCGDARESGDGRPVEDPVSAPPQPKGEAHADSGGRDAAPPRRRRAWALTAAAALALLAAGWYVLRAQRTRAPDEASTAVPLTSLPGVELDPALSPDASRVAFVWDGPDRNNFDVYVKEIGGGEMVRVTHDPAPDHRPVWSPDGRRIAFLRRRGRGADVLLVPAGGGQEQKLAELSDLPRLYVEDVWSFGLDWSPDGRFLAASDRGADGQSWGVFLISAETGEKRALTATGSPRVIDRLPAFSPDGRALAFLRGHFAPEADLLVQPLTEDGTPAAPARVLLQAAAADPLFWMPGGQELVAGDQRVSADGSRARPSRTVWRVSDPLIAGLVGQVSLRGTRLVFSTPQSLLRLFRVDLAGARGGEPQAFLASTRGETHAAFSPDGRKVAFTSRRSVDGLVWVCNVDGSGCHELPHPSTSWASSPAWSPDGRRLAFDAGVGDQFHVFITAPEGGVLRPLTSSRTYDARPRYSTDGKWIYFTSTRSGDYQIWRMRADAPDADAAATQMTRQGGIEAEESPDGRYLYYAKRNRAGLWRLSLGEPRAREEKVLDIGGEGLWSLRPEGEPPPVSWTP
jgi:Tol biopolymer transport system component/DNA-binding winged helix-turn-helix (wHTH) protein